MKYIKKLPEENQNVLNEKVKILKESGEHGSMASERLYDFSRMIKLCFASS